MVFLLLAALYESWSIPLAVMHGHPAGRDRRAVGDLR
jgi:multidrug efflux pump subunit AcrB